jgi:hypothetical protein
MRKNINSISTNDVFILFRTADDIGRYYVLIRNIEGTSGDVYIDFHGDHLSSSGEQHLLKCENYPEHPFGSKHTVKQKKKDRLTFIEHLLRIYFM